MSTNNSTNSILVFENTEFDVVDIHNIPWLRSPQIADALGMRDRRGIHDLYTRNADEFTPEMTQVIDLPTAGGIQQVRIFSPRGCYLIGMLSRTEKAKEFRKWVLDVLEGRQIPHETRPLTVPQRFAGQRLLTSLFKDLKSETAPGMRGALYTQIQQMTRLLAIPCPPIAEIGREVVQQELPGV